MIALMERLAAARGELVLWAPVCLAAGIGTYFALPAEPSVAALGLAAAAGLALCALALSGPWLIRPPALALALAALGLALAGWRAHQVAAPVLAQRYYGPVEGRIVDIDRSFSDRQRITLDRVVLKGVAPERTPERVRVALHGDIAGVRPVPGLRVILTAHLSPPEGPVEPGGFDFQRLAWFARLGAVGYTRVPVLALEPPEDGLALFAFRLRTRLAEAMRAAMPGQPGAFAAALMTGDRSAVTRETLEALRGANLSHLIAISGLHMGLLSGFVFVAFRSGLALVPAAALRVDARKLAALVALAAATFYLVLSGGSVATRRAYVMAAVMLVAILADRRAISLRSVAIAALIVLVLEPESLVEPGFQMSFGATVALVAVFRHWARLAARIPRWLRPVAMLVLSSATAGLATAPIAAAHFNRIAEYGLIANLVAVPLMGSVVMPLGVIAAVLAPLGLAAPALWGMARGTALILLVAQTVSGWEGAVLTVPAPPGHALAALALAGLCLFVCRTPALRLAGAAGLALVLALWAAQERPALLVAADGTLAGLLGPEGRALSRPRGAGFVAQSWLEDDGDPADQATAFARPGFSGQKGALRGELGGRPVWLLSGKGGAARLAEVCAAGALVILAERWRGAVPGDCLLYDAGRLARTGSLAIGVGPAGFRIVTARETAGARLWNRTPPRPAWRDAARR
ncbi:ComEC/Rec2 family competence protein [Albidovulum sp.]